MAAKPSMISSGQMGLFAEHAPVPMALIEGTSHIACYINPAFCRLIGKTNEELIGVAFDKILPTEVECLAVFDRVYKTGKPENYTVQGTSKTHSGIFSYTIWPVHADNQTSRVMIKVNEMTSLQENTRSMNEALVLGSVRQHELTETANSTNALLQVEISERKIVEKALKEAQTQLTKHSEELEEIVAERTSELTVTNTRLEASVDFIKKGKEEYRLLLLESQVMQKKLSLLTRQILTAQEEERKEISRELHDGVIQTLVGINIQLAALGSGEVLSLRRKIARAQKLVKDSVNEVHRFARELRPAMLDDLGLIPALLGFTKNLEKQKRIKISLTSFDGVEALGADERIVLFRVAQEALNNVVRHARATQVKIRISKTLGAIQMEISDNGKSFPVEKAFMTKNPKRLGLVGMKERMEMVGGGLTIESAPGKGTTVRAHVPFTSEESK